MVHVEYGELEGIYVCIYACRMRVVCVLPVCCYLSANFLPIFPVCRMRVACVLAIFLLCVGYLFLCVDNLFPVCCMRVALESRACRCVSPSFSCVLTLTQRITLTTDMHTHDYKHATGVA